MRTCPLFFPAVVLAAFALAGCEAEKSSTPLSPSVAGPIAGVSISAPQVVSPSPSSRIQADTAVVLTVKNASSNGVRPLTYVFEIATDSGFTQKVYSRSKIPPGEGQTSHRVADLLAADHSYYWRAHAEDGANTGDYTPAAVFTVYTPVVLEAPVPSQPANGAALSTLHPTFIIGNAPRTGPAGTMSYTLEVAQDQAFSQRVYAATFGEQAGQTQMTPESELPSGVTLYWRVRAADPNTTGPWSATLTFSITATTSPTDPPPPSSPTPPPSANDAIDLRSVTVVKGANIASWAVTSTVTGTNVNGGQICINHTMAGRWPLEIWFDQPGVYVEGNQWVFANIGGKWYGGAGEWLRPGQTCKPVSNIGPDVFYDAPPLRDWQPRSGEMVGLAVSTPARAGQWGIAERSNVVLVRWP